ncbi:NapC/NirT family cytochrome c [Candidatus Hydrogenedentota bacterium]
MARKRFLVLSSEALQGLGLLLALILLMAGIGYAAARPGLASLLVFLFSLPYLVAAVVSRRAHFLYPHMLLGAVAYFMLCFAMGATLMWFPLLSVPLVLILLWVGKYIDGRLDPALKAFPQTTYRAMNITVAVFACWALFQLFSSSQPLVLLCLIAGLAFMGYAGLYILHCVAGASIIYVYVLTLFAVAGLGVWGTAVTSIDYCWVFTLASSAVVACLGTRLHRERTLRWSRHSFICFAAVIVISLVFSLLHWSYFLYALAVSAILLWQAYRWFARAVGNPLNATTNERLVPRYFLLGTLILSAPLVPLVFFFPADVMVVGPALIFGLLFSWIAVSRRDQSQNKGSHNAYVLLASLFRAAGLVGIAAAITGAPTWPMLMAVALIIGAAQFYRGFKGNASDIFLKSIAESTMFPAFFAWYTAFSIGGTVPALVGAVVSVTLAVGFVTVIKDGFFICGAGPAIAGLVVMLALMISGDAQVVWIICAAASGVAGGVYVYAKADENAPLRQAATMAWLVLAFSIPVIAFGLGLPNLLFSVTTVAFLTVLMTRKDTPGEENRDWFDWLVPIIEITATVAVIILCPVSGVGQVVGGTCIIILSVAYWLIWASHRSLWRGRAGVGLLTLGILMIIFGQLPAPSSQIFAGAILVFLLLALALAVRKRCVNLSATTLLVAYLTSITLAFAALYLGWAVAGPPLAIPGLALCLIHALTPSLNKNMGMKLGAACWLSIAFLFFLAARTNTYYADQIIWISLLSIIWLAVGFKLHRIGRDSCSMALYMSAMLLALFCGGISVFAEDVSGAWQVFLINGLIFACLFLLLRQDIFAYMLTLSLSLMAYDWVRLSTTHFTQELLSHLVIFMAVLGIFFLLPLAKKLAMRVGSVPLFSIFTWQGAALIVLCVLGAGLLVSSMYALEITAHPKFCTACHNMGKFYESWQHSSHNEVACIECHYEPGVKATVEGKMGAMVQVAKFVTSAYGGEQPHGIVTNGSCMRVGCHDTMEQSTESLLFRGKIKFRHSIHLTEHPRGKELNCVSCHGQVVGGKHISISETTCLTCHFYGRGETSVAQGECQTCHIIPEFGEDSSFDHQAYLEDKDKVRCEHCHNQVTEGDGSISPVRCRSCHLSDHETTMDQEEFHLKHVSEGHFECLQCHDEIKHGMKPTSQSLLAAGDCTTCHGGDRHTIQERIYAGTAVPELDVWGDYMYDKGVSCDGCHTDMKQVEIGAMTFTMKASGARQCSDCHDDEGYGEMLEEWQAEIKERLLDLQGRVDGLEPVVNSAGVDLAGASKAKELLQASRRNLQYVMTDGSYGAHNYEYITSILDHVEEGLDECDSIIESWPEKTGEGPTQ